MGQIPGQDPQDRHRRLRHRVRAGAGEELLLCVPRGRGGDQVAEASAGGDREQHQVAGGALRGHRALAQAEGRVILQITDTVISCCIFIISINIYLNRSNDLYYDSWTPTLLEYDFML